MPCKTCAWYDQLDEEDRAFFDDKARAIENALNAGGMPRFWRACCAPDPDNSRWVPLRVGQKAFGEHLRNHHYPRHDSG
jgi:hypothetical protein